MIYTLVVYRKEDGYPYFMRATETDDIAEIRRRYQDYLSKNPDANVEIREIPIVNDVNGNPMRLLDRGVKP